MILVTGGTGFIGSHLLERLVSQSQFGPPGECVRALVRSPGSVARLPPAVEAVHGDLMSGEGLPAALAGVDTVFHLAGVTKPLSVSDYYSGNVTATENLARAIAATARPIRMVHVSSFAAVGPGSDSTPVTEDAEPHPIAHYGKSKLEGERRVRAILPDAVIVRPPAVYGPRDTDVFEILKSVCQGLVVRIAGSGWRIEERWFSAIYVADLVDGIIAAARAPQAAGRAYFLAHAGVPAWSELIGIAARIMNRKPRIVTIPAPVAYAVGYGAEIMARLTHKPGIVSRDKVAELQCRYWVCDTRRAKAELGFESRTDIQTGMALTLAWYREAGWLKY
jgi:nucleoside-diphosphate-sugar epimerase